MEKTIGKWWFYKLLTEKCPDCITVSANNDDIRIYFEINKKLWEDDQALINVLYSKLSSYHEDLLINYI
jgi:hypothetical protein